MSRWRPTPAGRVLFCALLTNPLGLAVVVWTAWRVVREFARSRPVADRGAQEFRWN